MPGTVFKRPLTGQRSNPESTRKVKPPRPPLPPPYRQIPPRSYVHLDSITKNQAKGTALGGRHHPVVVDTRGQRGQRSNRHRSPQPERPPLPYETFAPQKQPNHTNSSHGEEDHNGRNINGSLATVKDRQGEGDQAPGLLVTPPPAEYEVVVRRTVVAAGPRKSSVSADNSLVTETNSTGLHPLPGSAVRKREVSAGGRDCNKVENLANRRNEHRESVAVPYEVPTTITGREKITTTETHIKDSATVPGFEHVHSKRQQLQLQTDQGNDDTDQGDVCIPI